MGRKIQVKVFPKARENRVVGWEEDVLKLRITAAPEKGKANEAVIALLADHFGVAKRDIQIVGGETSRLKKVEIK